MIKKKCEYGLLLFVAFIFHIFIVDYISFWILAFLVLLPLVSLLITAYAEHGITAELIVNKTSIQKNESLPIQLKIYNKFYFLVCRIKVKLTLRNELLQTEQTRTFFITSNQYEKIVEQTFYSEHCGMIICNITELRIYDSLGLFSFLKKVENSHLIAVLPSIYPIMGINSAVRLDLQNNESMQIIKGNDPSEILDIHEYRDGDRLTKIHWKLSAKLDQLMVKDFGDLSSIDVLILLDLNGTNIEQINGLMDTIYSVSTFLLEKQIAYEMEWYDSIHKSSVHTSIAQKDELELTLEAILLNGRSQQQPWVLKSFSSGYGNNPYSVVLYLCSEITLNSTDLLHKLFKESKISILLVTDYIDPLKTNIMQIDLKNIKQNLGSLVI